MDDRGGRPAREEDDTAAGGSGFTPSDPGRGAFRAAIVCFAVATVSGIGAAWAYAADRSDRLLGICLASALSGIGFGSRVVGPLARPRRTRRPAARSRCAPRPTSERSSSEIVDETVATVGRRKLLDWCCSARSAPASPSASSDRSARSDPSRGAALTTTGWAARTPPRHRRGRADRRAATVAGFDQLATVFPRASSAVTTHRSCCSGSARTAVGADDRGRSGRRVGRLLEDLHACRMLGRPVRHRRPAARHRCASWSARATNRCSTRPTPPSRSAGPRRVRSRSSRSASTPTAT